MQKIITGLIFIGCVLISWIAYNMESYKPRKLAYVALTLVSSMVAYGTLYLTLLYYFNL